jgi:hypothetical protein
MASTSWTWDGHRQKWYQYSASESAYIYEDGERLLASSQASEQSTIGEHTSSAGEQ